MNNKKILNTEFIFLLFLLSLCVILLIGGLNYPKISRALPIPIAIITIVLITYQLKSLLSFKKSTYKNEKVNRGVRKRLFVVASLIILYWILIKLIGYFFSTAVFAIFCMLALGFKEKKGIFFITVFLLLTLYIVFGCLFKLPFPKSLVGF